MAALEFLALRFSSGAESTLGALFELGIRTAYAPPATDRRFLCFLIEDQWQPSKVPGETRIPAGRYRIRLRRFGGFHARYSARFPDMHAGMLELLDVPGFTDILVHCGNGDNDTAGCLIVADHAFQNVTARGRVEASEAAYRRVYPRIAQAAARLEGAFITFQDYG